MSEAEPSPADSTAVAGQEDEPLLRVSGLKKYFTSGGGFFGSVEFDLGEFPPFNLVQGDVKAVDDVSFEIQEGETLGVVGESGCGKSTLARTILQLTPETEGDVYFKGENLAELSGDDLREKRKDIQMIFQDPQSSLDPRMKVGPIIEEPMKAHGMLDETGREARAKELLGKVGLDPQHYNRYPHAFSGGQRQRVNLARALSVNPDFIVADEPVSALDVSIQAQVLNTMEDLQEEFGLTYLFIAHDLSVIRYISDRVAVMYLGNIVEVAEKDELFENPQHPYTKALLESIPVPDPRATEVRGVLEGDVPSPIDPPSGCRFRTRCPEFIAPDQYDFTESEWETVRAFTRAVIRRTFEPAPHREIEDTYFPDGLPRGEPADILEAAIAELPTDPAGQDLESEWEAATEVIREAFVEPSICTRERPRYEIEPVHGDGQHVANCHLHRDSGRVLEGD